MSWKMYELNMSPTLFFYSSFGRSSFFSYRGCTIWKCYVAYDFRVRFKWFFTIYLWCNGSLVGEKRERNRPTRFTRTHKIDDLKE